MDSSKVENKSLFGYYQEAWSTISLGKAAAISFLATFTPNILYFSQLSPANNIIVHNSVFQLAGKLFYQQDYNPKVILKDIVIGCGTVAIQIYFMPESIYENPILTGFLSGLASDSIDLALTTTIAETLNLIGLTSGDSVS